MPLTITNSFEIEYDQAVKEQYQRKTAMLRPFLRPADIQDSLTARFQTLSKATDPQTKVRHGIVALNDVDHGYKDATLKDYYCRLPIDDMDRFKTSIQWQTKYQRAAGNSINRQIDKDIVTEADGQTTYETSVNLSAITVATLTGLITTLGDRDVPTDDGDLVGVVSWKVWDKMMQLANFTSADYVTDMPLTKAVRPVRWMGVLWMPFSGLTIAANVRSCHVWHKEAFGKGENPAPTTMIERVAERDMWQVMTKNAFTCKRIEDAGFQKLKVTENA